MKVPIAKYPDYSVTRTGDVIGRRGKKLVPSLHRGYHRVWLYNEHGRKRHRVHVLVLEAFIGPRPSKRHEGAHFDGDRTNNNIKNLRWATKKQNAKDKRRHGTILAGDAHPCAKVTEFEIVDMFAMRSNKHTYTEIGFKHRLHPSHVGRIIRGESHKRRRPHGAQQSH